MKGASLFRQRVYVHGLGAEAQQILLQGLEEASAAGAPSPWGTGQTRGAPGGHASGSGGAVWWVPPCAEGLPHPLPHGVPRAVPRTPSRGQCWCCRQRSPRFLLAQMTLSPPCDLSLSWELGGSGGGDTVDTVPRPARHPGPPRGPLLARPDPTGNRASQGPLRDLPQGAVLRAGRPGDEVTAGDVTAGGAGWAAPCGAWRLGPDVGCPPPAGGGLERKGVAAVWKVLGVRAWGNVEGSGGGRSG